MFCPLMTVCPPALVCFPAAASDGDGPSTDDHLSTGDNPSADGLSTGAACFAVLLVSCSLCYTAPSVPLSRLFYFFLPFLLFSFVFVLLLRFLFRSVAQSVLLLLIFYCFISELTNHVYCLPVSSASAASSFSFSSSDFRPCLPPSLINRICSLSHLLNYQIRSSLKVKSSSIIKLTDTALIQLYCMRSIT